jgi:hypothetical protein
MTAGEISSDFPTKLEQHFPKSDRIVRIKNLWPSDYLLRLLIEPAIPQDFVMKRFPDKYLSGYFVWGAKETLDKWDLKDAEHLRGPVLCFRPSEEMAQTGLMSFSMEDQIETGFAQMGVKEVSKKTSKWGTYPVLHVSGKHEGRSFFSAWIGCNYCSNTLFARPMFPCEEGRPNKDDIGLWENFLSKTKQLSGQDCLLAQGWDLESGYTWFDVNGMQLLCVVERRRRDSKVQVVVYQNEQTSFSFQKVDHERSAMSWRREEELVKVYGDLSAEFSDATRIESPGIVINVFVKAVDEFSLDNEDLQKDLRIFVYQTTLKPI